jgi:hypothetical protein
MPRWWARAMDRVLSGPMAAVIRWSPSSSNPKLMMSWVASVA